MSKTSDFFEQKFIDEMKAVLLEEKEKVERSLNKIGHKSANGKDYQIDFPEYGNEDGENANEIADYTNNLSLETELEKALRDVNGALKRIENNTYGVCKYTGESIGEDRLRARPTSTSSIASKRTLTQEF